MLGWQVRLAFICRLKDADVAPDDVLSGITEHPLRAVVPARDVAPRIQDADRVVVHAVKQDSQPLLGLPQPLGLVVEVRINRDHAAVGFSEFVLEID